jgi:chromate reductase
MQYHLRMALTSIEAIMFGKPEIFVGMAASKLDEKTGELKDEATRKIIGTQLAAFAKFIERVRM